ncbi:MAG: acyl-CoA dehydrogenase, partial [Mesorhizobium sp.]
VRTTLDVVQVFGGYGFLSEFDVERAVRDAIGSKLYSGTSEIQRNIIAGWLGL